MANELYHHGIKGMHWGIRRFQSYDTVPRKSGKTGDFIGRKRYGNKELKRESDYYSKTGEHSSNGVISRNPSDIVIKKGTQLQRASNDSEDEFRDYKYVSINGFNYLKEVGGDRVLYYTNDKDIVIAGKKTVNNLLSKMGARTLDDRMTSDFNNEDDWLNDESDDGTGESKDKLNFMGDQKKYSDREFAIEFAKKLRDIGYDGMFDPEDSAININDSHNTARDVPMIMVNDVLRKTGERTSDELLQEALVKQKEAQTQTHKKKKFLFF